MPRREITPKPGVEGRPIPEQHEREQDLSLEEFERLFRERPELIEGIKKSFSVSLRCALASDFEGRQMAHRRHFDKYRTDHDEHITTRNFEELVDGPPLYRRGKEAWTTDREAILGADFKKRYIAETIFRVREAIPGEQTSIWASFVFSADEEVARRYWNQGQILGGFAAPQELQFHGIYIGQPRQERRVPLAQVREHPKFSALTIDRRLIDGLLEWIDRPIEECADAVAEIERLGKELGFEPEKIEKLKQAVRDFATYVKPEPTTNEQCFREIGRCMTVPHTFKHFAREWHALDVGDDFYEHSYAGRATFYHEVNVVDGKMVVDWTARQYHEFDKESYPFVYGVGGPKIPQSWGPLRLMEMRQAREAKRNS